MKRPVAVLFYVFLFLALSTCKCKASGLREEVSLALRGDGDPTMKEEKKEIIERLRKQIGGASGDKFASALERFDDAIQKKIDETENEFAKSALIDAKKTYDSEFCNWGRMNHELKTDKWTVLKAIGDASSDILATAQHVSEGKTIDALASGMTAVGAICMAIPGGQAFGIGASFLGVVFGFFCEASQDAAEPAITLDDITAAVTKAMRRELADFGSQQVTHDLLTRCKVLKGKFDNIKTRVSYWVKEQQKGTLEWSTTKEQLFQVLEQMSMIVQEVGSFYDRIDASVEDSSIIAQDALCIDSCSLGLIPREWWGTPKDTDKVLEELNFPVKCTSGDSSKKYLLCTTRDTYNKCRMVCGYSSCWDECNDFFTCEPRIPGCVQRADRHKECKQKAADSLQQQGRIMAVLFCGRDLTARTHFLLRELKILINMAAEKDADAVRSLDAKLGESFALFRRPLFQSLHRTPKKIRMVYTQEKAFDCNAADVAQAFGYREKVLTNSACVTLPYQKFLGGSHELAKPQYSCPVVQQKDEGNPAWDLVPRVNITNFLLAKYKPDWFFFK